MSDFSHLNQSQLAAINWGQGPLLLLAGPGSGKTATLIMRIACLIKQSEEESYRILCLTFTRRAAVNVRERLLDKLPQGTERALVTTFHSFATDILRQHGSHFGLTPEFEILSEAERIDLLRLVISEKPEEFTKFVSAEKALKAIDFVLRNATPVEEIPSLLRDVDAARQLYVLFTKYKELLTRQNCLDFGSILYFCEELLRERPRVSRQLLTVYRYICVDEFQDTTLVQYRILRALAPKRNSNLFLVGDDDQVIFQWTGASPSRIREIERDYDLTTLQLPENYRCPPHVVSLANALIVHNSERSPGKAPSLSMKEHEVGNTVEVLTFDDDLAEANGIADHIAIRIMNGAAPSDIAVLARTTRLLERIRISLNRKLIGNYSQRRTSQFESAPLRFIMAALKLALVRSDEELASAVTKALSDCVAEDLRLEDLITYSADLNGDQLQALGALVVDNLDIPKEIQKAVSILVHGNYSQFIEQTLAYFDSLQSGSRDPGEEQFAEYSTERLVWRSIVLEIGGSKNPYSLSLGQFLQELALANKTSDTPSNAVQCLTIHSSKGLEFRHVYLVGMAEDQMPPYLSKLAGDGSREMQEERRNCFVAITRTIQTLTMSYAHKYGAQRKKPSRFLYEMGLL
ncbi:ATP-dependent helicase [Janthinobacterium sp. 1_2014MBL_MicDiv]|uniref:ATP-dependent helicase n=1 Tax=Janthinobacterium sp. 1_2014MBL_MicDiv TaxID=1644131 RepID=UPI0009F62594|nr:ATP-dependent helicase [Janthinobacterium sp. 1_2014MBL_MicDiv]